LARPTRAGVVAAHRGEGGGGLAERTQRAAEGRRRGSRGRDCGPTSRRRPQEEIVRSAGRWWRGRRWRLRPGRLRAHLYLEVALGEGGLDVVHQVLEHVIRFLLVLDQRVLLAPTAVVNRVP